MTPLQFEIACGLTLVGGLVGGRIIADHAVRGRDDATTSPRTPSRDTAVLAGAALIFAGVVAATAIPGRGSTFGGILAASLGVGAVSLALA